MKRTDLKLFVALFFLIIIVLEGCSSDNFKKNSMKARAIIQNATRLLKVMNVENLVDKGKIKSTIFRQDNTEAKEYLKSKKLELKSYYQAIKDVFIKSDERYHDALFVLAFINEMTFFLSENAVEDQCKYIKIIRKEQNVKLSEWVLDEFFAPLKSDKDYINNWRNMNTNSKYEVIYNTLMAPDEKGKKCEE